MLAGGFEEAVGSGDLPAEVARVELESPHRFVDVTQVADGERLGAEGRGDGGVFQLGTCVFEPVAEDRCVVKGQLAG